MYFTVYFFFSSRRRHTRLQGDWSSDVCSSDLCRLAGDHGAAVGHFEAALAERGEGKGEISGRTRVAALQGLAYSLLKTRSEERRVGKECRSRWSPYH